MGPVVRRHHVRRGRGLRRAGAAVGDRARVLRRCRVRRGAVRARPQ